MAFKDGTDSGGGSASLDFPSSRLWTHHQAGELVAAASGLIDVRRYYGWQQWFNYRDTNGDANLVVYPCAPSGRHVGSGDINVREAMTTATPDLASIGGVSPNLAFDWSDFELTWWPLIEATVEPDPACECTFLDLELVGVMATPWGQVDWIYDSGRRSTPVATTIPAGNFGRYSFVIDYFGDDEEHDISYELQPYGAGGPDGGHSTGSGSSNTYTTVIPPTGLYDKDYNLEVASSTDEAPLMYLAVSIDPPVDYHLLVAGARSHLMGVAPYWDRLGAFDF